MKILALESSATVASVALLDGDALLAEYTTNYKKTHSQTLLPMVDEIIRMTETPKDSLQAVAISRGPGSFTGLRIGAATAKGIALALQIPIIPVPTLDAMAYQCFGTTGLVCPMMDARRSQVYTALYRFDENGDMETVMPEEPLALTDLIARINELGEEVLFLGDGVPVSEKQLRENLQVPYRFAPAYMASQRAASVATLAAKLAEEGKAIPGDAFAPEYLRVSQAERERMAKEGKTDATIPGDAR